MAIKGAIIGDIIGSAFEFGNPIAEQGLKPQDFIIKWAKNAIYCEKNDNKSAILSTYDFTDDTVLTLATKYAVMNNIPFANAYAKFGKKYHDRGFGGMFLEWLYSENKKPYGSYGNGSAMRISYLVDYYCNGLSVLTKEVRESAECTHNHPEGVKGAIVTAVCAAMAKQGKSKEDMLTFATCEYPKEQYPYSPEIPLSEMREYYVWNATCQGSVPVAIRCVYEANSYTEFIKNVLSIKCDTDTLCAIGGGIAEELFDNSADPILSNADEILRNYLDDYLLEILEK